MPRSRPARAGRRKIVLATNIAETSLTIDGVRVVIDAGLERRSLFDPASGMNRLELQRISRASAEQRAGRAGRTAPGVCYRLWGEGAERSLAAYAPPEVCVADLAPLALDLAAWGTEAGALQWLDAPPAATLASARDLLRRLGALDEHGKVTAHGRAMQQFPAHPRLAHMLLKARDLGASRLAGRACGAAVGSRPVARRRWASRQRCAHAARGFAQGQCRARRPGSRAPLATAVRAAARELREGRIRCGARRGTGRAAGAWRIRTASRAVAPALRRATSSAMGAARVFASRRVHRAGGVHRRRGPGRSRPRGADPAGRATAQGGTARTLRAAAPSRRRARLGRTHGGGDGAACHRAGHTRHRGKAAARCAAGCEAAAMLEGIRSMGLDSLPWDDESPELRGAQRVRARTRPQGRRGLAGSHA